MNWTVKTNAAKLAKKAILHFTEMTGRDAPPSRLAAGDTFNLELADGSRTGGTVRSMIDSTLEIELKDGSAWTLTPHRDGDGPLGIESPGLHSQDWVIR
jgi:hypothetical protein